MFERDIKKDFAITGNLPHTLHIISIMGFKSMETFKNIEDKLTNNEMTTDRDIASRQAIVDTDYGESQLEILLNAHGLIERISEI